MGLSEVHVRRSVYHAGSNPGYRARNAARRPAWRVTATALAAIAPLALFAAGCGRAPRPVVMPGGPAVRADSDRIAVLLRHAVERWRREPDARVPARDLDCSAFVAAVYREVFNLSLPRSSEEMARIGRQVAPRKLQPGDLVFFRPQPGKRHVGFYVGQGEFGHLSERSGICISRLGEAYWRKSYWTARRVIDG